MEKSDNQPIIDNCDKIIYYDMDGKVLREERVLNANHPHDYFNIRRYNQDKTIRLDNQDYKVIESSILYARRYFGTLHITHLKLMPFIDGQHY